MKRLNEEAVVRALFPFGQQHVDRLRDRIEVEAIKRERSEQINDLTTSDKRQLIYELT